MEKQIIATGKIVDDEIQWRISPLPVDEPPTRDQRAEESAALYDNARYYEWAKREAQDYEDYLAEIEWLRLGC